MATCDDKQQMMSIMGYGFIAYDSNNNVITQCSVDTTLNNSFASEIPKLSNMFMYCYGPVLGDKQDLYVKRGPNLGGIIGYHEKNGSPVDFPVNPSGVNAGLDASDDFMYNPI